LDEEQAVQVLSLFEKELIRKKFLFHKKFNFNMPERNFSAKKPQVPIPKNQIKENENDLNTT
jgi:hypothetical protein